MKKFLLAYTASQLLLYGNMFVVTDASGKVVEDRQLVHTENPYLTQKATEYSYQAIYDELHKAENLARLAEAARQHSEDLHRKELAAAREGRQYTPTAREKAQLIEDAKYFKGGKYVWGGTTPEGFDCSGYVQYLYKKQNIDLPRTALEQSGVGRQIALEHIKKGDLLFFNTDKSRGLKVSHVGIYMGNGEFIHAASKDKGIIISPLAGKYENCFVVAKRVLGYNNAPQLASLEQ